MNETGLAGAGVVSTSNAKLWTSIKMAFIAYDLISGIKWRTIRTLDKSRISEPTGGSVRLVSARLLP